MTVSEYSDAADLLLSDGGPNGRPLDPAASLDMRLHALHDTICRNQRFSNLIRIAVAIYDQGTDRLKTFLHSDRTSRPFARYEAALADVASLRRVAESGQYRITPSIDATPPGSSPHTRRLFEAGVRSSLTVPFYDHHALLGFVFFDADVANFFQPEIVDRLWPYAHLLSLAITSELGTVRLTRAAVATAQEVARHRDNETGAHVQRMSHFARVIARSLAPRHDLPDQFVEYMLWFAPLHDIGKVGVADAILLKAGKLSANEFDQMKQHVAIGVDIIDTITRQFDLAAMPHIAMLRNIVACHHENYDGSGYPHGYAGKAIPLEAHITTVADVFDALTSERPYKRRWSNAEALAHMRSLAGVKFDPDCVVALEAGLDEILAIQERFATNPTGDTAGHQPGAISVVAPLGAHRRSEALALA